MGLTSGFGWRPARRAMVEYDKPAARFEYAINRAEDCAWVARLS